MQYMLLVYDDPSQWTVSEDEMPAIYEEYAAVARDKATKHSAQLHGTETAKTVRVRSGETLVTEMWKDAAALAAKIPSARLGGSVEVRQIVEM